MHSKCRCVIEESRLFRFLLSHVHTAPCSNVTRRTMFLKINKLLSLLIYYYYLSTTVYGILRIVNLHWTSDPSTMYKPYCSVWSLCCARHRYSEFRFHVSRHPRTGAKYTVLLREVLLSMRTLIRLGRYIARSVSLYRCRKKRSTERNHYKNIIMRKLMYMVHNRNIFIV